MISSATLSLSAHLHLRTSASNRRRSSAAVSCQRHIPPPRPAKCRPCPSPASRRHLLAGAAAFLLAGARQDEAKAMGPLLEEDFWENMRRYVVYALTVSTGFAYAFLKPILELLRNPLAAVLLFVIAVGGVYLLTQVLSLMIGISDFSYDYAN